VYVHIFLQEIEKVILELGEEYIVQIITDNMSNYKNAYRLVSEVSDCVAIVHCSYYQFDAEVNWRVSGPQSNDRSCPKDMSLAL
jgi:hypothetical protein